MENGQWKMCGIKLHGKLVFPKFALSKSIQQSLFLTIKKHYYYGKPKSFDRY